jgi:YfiR/HmsC-like
LAGYRAQRFSNTKVRFIRSTARTAHCLARPYNSYFRVPVRGGLFSCLAALLLAVYFPLANRAVYADLPPTEYQVKAAFLFNFLKFVEWPEDSAADPHGKWVIGFVGDSPVGDELTRLVQGKNVLGRDLQVKKFQAADSPRACNVLFISESEKKRLPSILAELRGSSVLTVADMDNFIGAGGMIQFVVEDARVRVAIDVGATGRARLKVSSKLLSLARIVTGTDRGANN